MLKILDEKFEEIILVVLLGLMVSVLGIQIVARYIFNNSLSWSEEFVRYLFVWSAFMGIPYSIKKGISIRVDFFVYKMSYKNQQKLKVFNYLFIIALFFILAIFSVDVLTKSFISGQKSAAMGIPSWLLQASVLLSSFLSIIRSVQKLIDLRRTK